MCPPRPASSTCVTQWRSLDAAHRHLRRSTRRGRRRPALPLRLGPALLGIMVVASALADAPVVSFEEQAVRIEEATPNGRLVVFSIGKPRAHLMPLTARFEALVSADATGAASVELPRPMPVRSVWAVVDVESGEYVLAAPEAFGLRQVDFPGRGIGQTRRLLADERRFLDVLVVRPAAGLPAGADPAAETGAWTRTFGDGGEDDGDGAADGKLEAPFDRLRPIGDSPALPPGELRPGDVVIGVDPLTLEVYASRLAS